MDEEKFLDLVGFPESSDIPTWKKKSLTFTLSRTYENPRPGFVGEVDGISIQIAKPRRSKSPLQYFPEKATMFFQYSPSLTQTIVLFLFLRMRRFFT